MSHRLFTHGSVQPCAVLPPQHYWRSMCYTHWIGFGGKTKAQLEQNRRFCLEIALVVLN